MRFVDMMALHVAIRGISSHQRPAWTKHRKRKTEAKERTREALEGLLWTLDNQIVAETDLERRAELEKQRDELLDGSVEAFAVSEEPEDDASGAGCASERWEDITAAKLSRGRRAAALRH
jgi:DNA polymerase gamma 1